MKEKGKRHVGGCPLIDDPSQEGREGMERREALGLKSGKNPGQVGGGNTVGREGERQQETERDKERVRQKRRKTEKEGRQRKGKTKNTERRQGEAESARAKERRGEGGGELTRSQWSW